MTDLVARLQTALAGRYAVERELGRGGMATVFLAHDLRHDRPVALKVLHPELASALGPERFQREIHTLARLQHPHILPVHDSGEAGGQLWFTMPFIEGESLRDRLTREKQLPLEDALHIARNVSSALGYAHSQGIIHRDIKPENILLTSGEAMVADFGIARVQGMAGDKLTGTGLSIGTPAYMSPEQATGERDLDGRTDIYALGCVLYEMLAGEPPYTGPTTQAIIARALTEAPRPIHPTRNAVPPALDGVIARAMALTPADRFATMAEFARALAARDSVDRFASASQVVQAQGSPKVMTPPNPTPLATPVVAPTRKSIAVLPFTNMSNDPENEYFTDGMAEEIINALMKVQALQVASRTSAFAFKGQHQDIRRIGEQLGVTTVLEGSVRKGGQKLRITAQLINVADGYQLWSERYDREMQDVFAIQDEIAGNIVKALRVVLSEDEKRAIEKAPTADVRAYDFYLRGRQFLHQFRRTGILFARRMFERAIEIDPSYVQACAGAADCCSFLYMYWDASKANLEQADSYSRRALELGPEMAEAHASRGLALSLSKRYEEANAAFDTATRLGPQLFEAHYFYGRALFQQGEYEEAVREYEAAERIRPEDCQPALLAVQALRSLGRVDEAHAVQRRGTQLAERYLDLNPDDPRTLSLGASALMDMGEKSKALDWASRAQGLDPEDPGLLYNVACVYALGRQADQAFDCLERAIRNGFGHREWLENDSDLASLRGDPRLATILEKL